jgi:hypothetical protein
VFVLGCTKLPRKGNPGTFLQLKGNPLWLDPVGEEVVEEKVIGEVGRSESLEGWGNRVALLFCAGKVEQRVSKTGVRCPMLLCEKITCACLGGCRCCEA